MQVVTDLDQGDVRVRVTVQRSGTNELRIGIGEDRPDDVPAEKPCNAEEGCCLIVSLQPNEEAEVQVWHRGGLELKQRIPLPANVFQIE